uniref:MARVEL domain-containing protein n=1 Tax=Strigamia maritima TaxID=126957 RepID=T1J7M2_STRMM
MDHLDSPYRPVPANERMSPHYKGKTVQRLGVGHTLLALMSVGLQVALFIVKSPGYQVGTGFWAGFLFLVAGITAFLSASDSRRRPPAIAFLIASLVAASAAIAMLLIALNYALGYKPIKGEDWSVKLILMATLTVLGIAELLISIISIQLVFKGLCHCCVAVQQALETEAGVAESPKSMSPIAD